MSLLNECDIDGQEKTEIYRKAFEEMSGINLKQEQAKVEEPKEGRLEPIGEIVEKNGELPGRQEVGEEMLSIEPEKEQSTTTILEEGTLEKTSDAVEGAETPETMGEDTSNENHNEQGRDLIQGKGVTTLENSDLVQTGPVMKIDLELQITSEGVQKVDEPKENKLDVTGGHVEQRNGIPLKLDSHPEEREPNVETWMKRYMAWYNFADKLAGVVRANFIKMRVDITIAIRNVIEKIIDEFEHE